MESNPFPPRKKLPESEKKIQDRIIKSLKDAGYFAKQTFGTCYQTGIPDIFAYHKVYGTKWVEVKRPKGSHLEASQIEVFSAWEERNVSVWILTAPDLGKLLEPPNWRSHDTGRTIKTERIEKRSSSGPERDLQEDIKSQLRATGWHCTDIHGHTFSNGFPDFYACHKDFGARFIEVKYALSFTPSQKRVFREMLRVGCPVWILRTPDITPLFQPANLKAYSKYLPAQANPLRR